jgi:hypothetical protein
LVTSPQHPEGWMFGSPLPSLPRAGMFDHPSPGSRGWGCLAHPYPASRGRGCLSHPSQPPKGGDVWLTPPQPPEGGDVWLTPPQAPEGGYVWLTLPQAPEGGGIWVTPPLPPGGRGVCVTTSHLPRLGIFIHSNTFASEEEQVKVTWRGDDDIIPLLPPLKVGKCMTPNNHSLIVPRLRGGQTSHMLPPCGRGKLQGRHSPLVLRPPSGRAV